MSELLQKPSGVLWRQTLCLAALQGAFSLCWLVYNLYLPKLLVQLGMVEEAAKTIILVEMGLAIACEPLMGGLSDYRQREAGTRIPWIMAGVVLASAVFLGLPAVVIFGAANPFFQGFLVTLLVGWSLAMTVFRSPMLSLLARYSVPAELPQAFSIVTLAGGLIGSLRPVASTQILQLGPAFAFGLGSFVLLGTAAALRAVHPPDDPFAQLPKDQIPDWKQFWRLWLGITVMGGAIALAGRLILADVVPQVLPQILPMLPKPNALAGVSLVTAGFSVVAGFLASKFGNQWLTAWAAVLAAVCGLSVLSPNSGLSGLILLGLLAGLGAVFNGTIPLILDWAPGRWIGLGIGFYFGGAAAMGMLTTIVLPKPGSLAASVAGERSAIALLLVAVGLFWQRRMVRN